MEGREISKRERPDEKDGLAAFLVLPGRGDGRDSVGDLRRSEEKGG